MKLVLILLFIVLAGGAFVGEKMVQDPGYVLLSYNNSTIETSVWVFAVIAFLLFLVTHWLVNLCFRVGLPTKYLGSWNRNRIAKNAQKRTYKGLIALSEGQWWQAQRLLSQTAPDAGQPLINYLGAAKAAHEQGDQKQTDYFFAQAREIAPEAEVSISLQEVEVLIDRGHSAQAFIILKRLHSLAPKHTGILRDLADLHQDQQDWDGLISLLPKLKKQKVLSAAQLAQLEALCYNQMLNSVVEKLPVESDSDTRVKALTKGWKALPNSLSKTTPMIASYAQALIAADAIDQADQFLRPHIQRTWDDELINIFGTIRASDVFRQYRLVVSWIKKQPEQASLQLCAARLAMENEDWPEAVKHYETSIALTPSIGAYRGLAKLLESLGEHEKALQISQKAMDFTDDDSVVYHLPAPIESATQADQEDGAQNTAQNTSNITLDKKSANA